MKIKGKTINKVAVLYGGWSAERNISVRSGKSVIKALNELGFGVVPIDVRKNRLKDLFNLKGKVDFVFISLHGKFGEDGTLQGLLELLDLPYSGSGILSSSIGMNKILTKKLLMFHNIPTPRWIEVKDEYTQKLKIPFKFPVVVKPVSQGSTIGVSIVNNYKLLFPAIREAKKYDTNVFIEEFIFGKEITAGIVGNSVLPLIEIVPVKEKFYNYSAKYTPGGSKHIIPANLPSRIENRIKTFAIETFKTINCRGVARVDFRVDEQHNPWVLEINTIPGMTEVSLLPEAAKYVGMNFNTLVLKIIEHSI